MSPYGDTYLAAGSTFLQVQLLASVDVRLLGERTKLHALRYRQAQPTLVRHGERVETGSLRRHLTLGELGALTTARVLMGVVRVSGPGIGADLKLESDDRAVKNIAASGRAPASA